MKYDKLVRDNIPYIIRAKGESAKTHIADGEEYAQKLLEKLKEEAGEFSKEGSMEELVDILEVIDAIKELKGFSDKEILLVKEQKRQKRGGFNKRIILEES